MEQTTPTSRDPFRLADLAELEPSTDAWPLIESDLRRQKRLHNVSVYLASAAALIALAIGIYWQLPSGQSSDLPTLAVTAEAQTPRSETAGGTDDNSLDDMVRLSQKLERNLRLIRTEIGVMPGQSLIYQVELEDLVAQVDEAISQQPDSMSLWSQRVNLLLDLNQLYRRELRRDESQVASL